VRNKGKIYSGVKHAARMLGKKFKTNSRNPFRGARDNERNKSKEIPQKKTSQKNGGYQRRT